MTHQTALFQPIPEGHYSIPVPVQRFQGIPAIGGKILKRGMTVRLFLDGGLTLDGVVLTTNRIFSVKAFDGRLFTVHYPQSDAHVIGACVFVLED